MNYDWSEYRKRRSLFILVMFSFIPVLIFIDSISKENVSLFYFLIFIWVFVFFFPTSWYFGKTPCPRCSKAIYLRSGFGFLFSPKCVNCDLKINKENN